MLRTFVSLVVLLAAATACGGSGADEPALGESPQSPPTSSPAALALVRTDAGVAAVPVGSQKIVWSAEGAAAPDGSAVFATTPVDAGRTRLARLDPRTGQPGDAWEIEGRLDAGAVAPAGRWVALTQRPPHPLAAGARTELVVFAPTDGRELHRLFLDGDVEPEAFSFDGRHLYTLRHSDTYYRVEQVDLETGLASDLLGRDKQAGEDMHGTAVQAVLSADGTILATLYRNPGHDDEPAFVHVLDVQNGWGHCTDLTAPFGTQGDETMLETKQGTMLVATRSGQMTAEIDVQSLHTPDPAVPVGVTIRHTTDAPALPAGLSEVPGFHSLVAIIPS